MNNMTGVIGVLKGVISESTSFPVFLITDSDMIFNVEVSKDAIGGNSHGVEIVFRQGRKLGLQHKQLRRSKSMQLMQITPGVTEEGEILLVSVIDHKTGTIDGMPFNVVRDKEGRFIDLIDTGGLVQIAGTFLFAFLIGINTSDLPEEQGIHALNREMKRLTNDLINEAKRRLGDV